MQALEYYENILTLELNSCSMDDQTLDEISEYFPPKLKHLHLIDNKLTDEALEKLLLKMNKKSIRF